VVKKTSIPKQLRKRELSSSVYLKKFSKDFLINSLNLNLLLRKELWKEERYSLSTWRELKLSSMKKTRLFKEGLRNNKVFKH
jgi:hypothetical protein